MYIDDEINRKMISGNVHVFDYLTKGNDHHKWLISISIILCPKGDYRLYNDVFPLDLKHD